MRASLLVSVHDIAPSTAWATRLWASELDRRGIPATLLVVPGPWEGPPLRDDRTLVRWLHGRVARGDEVVLHGWTHRAPRRGRAWRRALGEAGARGAAEFFALGARDTRRRLELGQAALNSAGLEVRGFTPPGWLASPTTANALRDLGFHYWASHRAVHDLVSDTRHPAHALSHRPGSSSEALAAWLVHTWTRRLARDGRSVRLALHPNDLRSPRLVSITLGAIDAVLAAGIVARTYGAHVGDPAAQAA